MKSGKTIYIVLAFLVTFSTVNATSPDWGATGHRTIGKIAEDYLKVKTKRKIAELLNGQSLALVSTFGDDIKSDKRYREFYTWHFVNMPFGVSYQDSEKNKDGDLVTGIKKCKEVILNVNTNKEDKAFYLKLLVHLMGDLHQPMHVGRKEDKGGNTFQLQWFDNGTNLHSVWDSKMINHYNMTYTELAENADKITKEQVKYLQNGTIEDWVNETQTFAIKAYESAEIGENLRYNYMYENFGLVRSQLQKGGIRLAKLLNELFS
ncbi:S1/P1 nuclease [Lutibacter oceani]|uniref:S1/P1 nuclease n=1 Tax=Lutibacter oceani TaxID=1853311 RepID=A0A3D9RZD4_9FLAO|nr:S1/P1 nuclease [Lutibacter oceani]REE82924.1 S1/P1 nuclease [Lutibacter oceani]